jgi:5-methylcytosine-specific restriction endonuclease McrA
MSKSERQKLVDKLDKIFSLYIRNRDGYRCVLCGRTKEIVPIDAGHLLSRVSHSVRWDEQNVFAQCRDCNLTHEYHAENFTMWFLNKFGKDQYERLYAKSKKPTKFNNADLKVMIDYYKNLIKEEEK